MPGNKTASNTAAKRWNPRATPLECTELSPRSAATVLALRARSSG
jgi:hypothetical protein